MKNLIRIIIVFLVITQLTSCGYTRTEDDKFPEMAAFPDHSNDKISIKSAGMRIDTIYTTSNNELMGYVEILDADAYGDGYSKKVIAKFDEKLNILDSVAVSQETFINKNGQFYRYNREGELERFDNISATPVLIPEHPFNGVKFKEDLEKEMAKNGPFASHKFPDSLSYQIAMKNDSLSYHRAADAFEKQVLPDLLCVKNTLGRTILTYANQEYQISNLPRPLWESAYGDRKTCYEILSEYLECDRAKKYITDYRNHIKITDQAVTGNGSSGGNHFVFGSFYTKGFEYYELEIEGQATTFKNYGNVVGSHRVTSRNLPGTNVYLIDVKGDMYDNPVTYIATLKE